MWSESQDNPNIRYYLHIEPTTRCNAACPICDRYVNGSTNVRPNLKLKDLTVENLDNWLGPDIIKKCRVIRLCGDYGDPNSNPYILDIIEYISNINTNMELSSHTNGGNRNPSFYSKLGGLMSKFRNHSVSFGIDGLSDTNHLYRRNVKWSRLMDNVKAFIGNGGHAIWDYITFEHNEMQIEGARNLANTLGFKQFRAKKSLGMTDVGSKTRWDVPVYDKDFNVLYNLSQAKSHTNFDYKLIERPGSKNLLANAHKFEKKVIDYTKYSHLNDFPISCEVIGDKNKGIYLTPNGTMLPCCYTGYSMSGFSYDSDKNNQLVAGVGGPNNINLKFRSYKEIFKTFDSYFYDGWNKTVETGKCMVCAENCGSDSIASRLFDKDRYPKNII